MKGYLAEPYNVRKKNLLDTNLVEEVLEIDSDPTKALEKIRPDFQVCGSDHSIQEVMSKGGQFVGKIVILPYTEGISSSDLYRKSKCHQK